MIITITEPLVQFEPELSHSLVNKRFRFKLTLLSAEVFFIVLQFPVNLPDRFWLQVGPTQGC